jgi:glutathione S-transferase
VLYTGAAPGFRQASLFAARRKMSAACVLQGVGRYSQDEVAALARREVDNLSTLLGEQPYFMGDRPSSVDATVFAYIAITLWAPLPKALKAAIAAKPNLVAYCELMRSRYFREIAPPDPG